MKKLLLTFIALFACVSYVAAQETVTELFDKDAASWYTTLKADADKETTLTSPFTDITYNSKQAYLEVQTGYLMLVKSAGIIKFNLDFPCSNITIYSKAGASGSQAVTVLAGSTTIKENTKIPNVADGNISIEVPETSQIAGTEFTIKVSAKYNVQITKIVYTKAEVNPNLKDANLAFSATEVEANLGEAFDKPELTKATTAEVVYSSSDEAVATVDATTGEVTLVAAGTTTITASAPANEEYKAGTASYTLTVIKPVVETTVALATEMTDGKFVLYTPQGVAKNYTGSNAFGYLFLEAVTPENNEFKVNEDYLIEFTNTDKGYTMKDCNGKFLGMDATHFGSFNFYDSADADGSNCYWTATFDGNNDVKIENAGRPGAYISYKQYNKDWKLVTTDKADQPLVQLYKVKDVNTAIEDIEAADAPVEYYNLQGIRVANPTSGLYIKRQGNKVTKVIL
ncbi:MAG: Ig-like domain-containing protein [Duncaniella sp.]|nr:Ig-like domain-containing protein [Duncaniella sp.]